MSYGADDTGWVEDPEFEIEKERAIDEIHPALSKITGQDDFYRGRGKDWRTIYSWAPDGNSLVAIDPQAFELVSRVTYLTAGYIRDLIIDHLTEEVPQWVTVTPQPNSQ